MTTKKKASQPRQYKKSSKAVFPAAGGSQADKRKPMGPNVPKDASEAWEARDHDRAVEEDEGMERGEIWPREEEAPIDEDSSPGDTRRPARSTAARFYEEDDEDLEDSEPEDDESAEDEVQDDEDAGYH
jgi:hypothetical protein